VKKIKQGSNYRILSLQNYIGEKQQAYAVYTSYAAYAAKI